MTDSPGPAGPDPSAPADRTAALTELARAAYSLSAADARLRGRATRTPGAFSLAHARALRVLAEGGPRSIRDLAAGTATTSAAATQLVNGLEESGYVTRERDLADRRAVLVNITPAGLARYEERAGQLSAALASSLGHLGTLDLTTATDVMRRLASIYDGL